VDDLYYRIKVGYECVISVPIILERMGLFLKQCEDGVGGVTGSERVCERILGQV
jgi:hypothetical protein